MVLLWLIWFNGVRCMEHLQKQDVPTGIELLDDEFILHVEGTASTQRVVRHIGGTSWPGACIKSVDCSTLVFM